METPFGQLGALDLSDHELCPRIISLDKHSLAEGLLVESVFDQYLAAFPRDQGNEPVMVEDDTAIAANPGDSRQFAFVWDRVSGQGLGRYLKALDHRYIVWLVRFSEPDRYFYAASCKDGKRVSEWELLDSAARRLSGRTTSHDTSVDNSVRDANRINQSFWGYLSAHYGNALRHRVALPRLFLNCGIQPWFRFNEGLFHLEGSLVAT